jgi:peptidoglycan/LPS O-acetylase OafA/YrhL
VLIHHAFSVMTGHVSGGGGAVTVFFVLSGYLLYRPFLRQVDLRAYAIRRTARILPAYWLALGGAGLVLGVSPTVGELLLLDVRTLGIAWTLQLEVAFYVTLPLLAYLLAGSPGRILAVTAAAVLGTVALLAISVMLTEGIDPHLLRIYPLMLWAFAPGMLVAALEAQGRLIDRRLLPVGIVIVAVSLAARSAYLDVPTALGSAVVVGTAVQYRSMRFARIAVVGGALSYSVYLWHLPLLYRFGWAAIPLSFAVAAVAYVALERPAIRLGRHMAIRFGKARSRPSARSPAHRVGPQDLAPRPSAVAD